MSDKEILFHLNSVASQAVITYVVKNMEDKYLEIFTDVNGNINVDLLGNAAKEFNDITQLLNLFKQNK